MTLCERKQEVHGKVETFYTSLYLAQDHTEIAAVLNHVPRKTLDLMNECLFRQKAYVPALN